LVRAASPGVAPPLAAEPSLARAGLLAAPSMAAANCLNYAFNLVMLRLLEPADYGALSALLAVILIGAVPGLALQAVVARHTALRAGDRAAVAALWSRTLVAVSWVSLGLGLAVAAAAPALAAFLRLGSLAPALWLAANILPLPLVATLQGMLQGVQRFGALAAALLLNAAVRLAVGIGLVAAGGGVDGALAASVAGSLVATLVPLVLLGPVAADAFGRRRGGPVAAAGLGGGTAAPPPAAPGATVPAIAVPAVAVPSVAAPGVAVPAVAALGREVGAAALAFLGLLLLTNLDLLLARHYLAAEPSGLYAAGSVVAKIAFWAPQFVATIVFPRLATEVAARRRLLAGAAAVIAGLGAALVVAVAAAPELAVTLPFGGAYRDVGPDLPLFAALGTALALVQLLLFSRVAAGDRTVHRLLAATVAVEVAVIALGPHHSVTGIVGAALAAVTALLGAGWVLERRRQPAEEAPTGVAR
jgi:O-antigen/teichoic acid export membrane protein